MLTAKTPAGYGLDTLQHFMRNKRLQTTANYRLQLHQRTVFSHGPLTATSQSAIVGHFWCYVICGSDLLNLLSLAYGLLHTSPLYFIGHLTEPYFCNRTSLTSWEFTVEYRISPNNKVKYRDRVANHHHCGTISTLPPTFLYLR